MLDIQQLKHYLIIVDDAVAHVDVRHDWLDEYYDHRRILHECLKTARAQICLFSFLPTPSLFIPPILSVPEGGSCEVLAHAGAQHQGALLRDLRVLDHPLPQPLLLSV